MEKESIDEILKDALVAKETPSTQLQEQLKQKLSDRRRKYRIFPGVAIAAGFLLVVTIWGATVFYGDIQATMKRIFGTITENYVDGNAGQKEQAEEEVYKIGETVTKQGIGITLEEVLLDANKIAYSMKVKADSPKIDVYAEIYLNGKKLSDPSSGIGWHLEEENAEVIVNEKELEPNMTLSGNVQVQLQIDHVTIGTKTVEDNWNFETTVNVDKANSHTFKEEMGLAVKLDNGDVMVINDVVRTSTDCKLHITYHPKELDTGDVELRIEGQDENNHLITSSGISMKIIKGTNDYNMVITLNGVSRETKKMTLTPYGLDRKTFEYGQMGNRFTVEFN